MLVSHQLIFLTPIFLNPTLLQLHQFSASNTIFPHLRPANSHVTPILALSISWFQILSFLPNLNFLYSQTTHDPSVTPTTSGPLNPAPPIFPMCSGPTTNEGQLWAAALEGSRPWREKSGWHGPEVTSPRCACGLWGHYSVHVLDIMGNAGQETVTALHSRTRSSVSIHITTIGLPAFRLRRLPSILSTEVLLKILQYFPTSFKDKGHIWLL